MEEEEVNSRQLKVERKKEGLRVVNCSAKGRGSPRTPVFWPKSAELIENKEVEFWMGAKKCKKMQKSSEEHETKEVECGDEGAVPKWEELGHIPGVFVGVARHGGQANAGLKRK